MANEVTQRLNNLPATAEGLNQFVLIGKERLRAHQAKIRAIEKVGMAEAARKAALQDGQDAGQVVIHAAARLGELLAAMPKTGNTLTSTGGRKGSLPPGVSHKTSHQAQTIAANPDKATRPHSVPICQLFKELFAERFGQGFVKLFAERFRQRFKKGGLLRP